MGSGEVAIVALSTMISLKVTFSDGLGGNSRFTKLLIWFGRNSLCLMLVHQLIKTILDKYTEYVFSNDLLYLCFQFLGTIFLSATLTILINNYIPILVGKRKV